MDNLFKIFLIFSSYSYLCIFLVLVFSGIGLPIPEELTLILAGFFIYQGIVRSTPMLVFCVFGVFLSDFIAFLLGHFYGKNIKERKLIGSLFSFRRVRKAERYSKILGNWVIVFGRFATGIRPLIFLFAGVTRINLLKFVLIDFIGSIISVAIWAGAGWFLSRHIEILLIYFYRFRNFVIYSIVAFVVIYFLDKYLVEKKDINFFPVRKLHKLRLSMIIAVVMVILGVAWQTVSYRLYLIRYLPDMRINTLYTFNELEGIIDKLNVRRGAGSPQNLCPNLIFTGQSNKVRGHS